MIGERMSWEDIVKEYPYKYVVLEDVTFDENNSVSGGILREVVNVENQTNKLMELKKDWPRLRLLGTFERLPFPECLKYGIWKS